MALYTFHISWYATGLRNDDMAAALEGSRDPQLVLRCHTADHDAITVQ